MSISPVRQRKHSAKTKNSIPAKTLTLRSCRRIFYACSSSRYAWNKTSRHNAMLDCFSLAFVWSSYTVFYPWKNVELPSYRCNKNFTDKKLREWFTNISKANCFLVRWIRHFFIGWIIHYWRAAQKLLIEMEPFRLIKTFAWNCSQSS